MSNNNPYQPERNQRPIDMMAHGYAPDPPLNEFEQRIMARRQYEAVQAEAEEREARLENEELQRALTQRQMDILGNRYADPESFIPKGENYPYQPGQIFLGVHPETGAEVGTDIETHALTIGGPRMGKTAGSAIPNLKRWPHSVFDIDPKGSHAKETIQAREAMGQRCWLWDPFDKITDPALQKYRIAINFYDGLSIHQPDIYERLSNIGHSLIPRFNNDPEKEFWDNAAATLWNGIAAAFLHIDGHVTLSDVRHEVRQLSLADEESRWKFVQLLKETGNPMAEAAAGKCTPGSKMNDSIIGTLEARTSWLDSAAAVQNTSHTTKGFRISDINAVPTSLYVVVPLDNLTTHAGALKVITDAVLKHALRGEGRQRLLMMLDEFPALGRMDAIKSGLATLPEYKTHIWVMAQAWQQIAELYGKSGADTILGLCWFQEFFSRQDEATPQLVSRKMGENPETERPYMTPAQYAAHISKDGPLARRKIVFMPGADLFISIKPKPYWELPCPLRQAKIERQRATAEKKRAEEVRREKAAYERRKKQFVQQLKKWNMPRYIVEYVLHCGNVTNQGRFTTDTAFLKEMIDLGWKKYDWFTYLRRPQKLVKDFINYRLFSIVPSPNAADPRNRIYWRKQALQYYRLFRTAQRELSRRSGG